MTSISLLAFRLRKFAAILLKPRLFLAFIKHGVMAGVEHASVLNMPISTVVDVGANKGQFALVARQCFPDASIFSFEPLHNPAVIYRRIFEGDNAIMLYESAIGPINEERCMHLSACDDSSSLLPISSLQSKVFPGTDEIGTIGVHVAPLSEFVSEGDISGNALLKLDVQGFEMEALLGCESLLHKFEWVYCECSFVELYSGQKLAASVIEWLATKSFHVKGIYNPSYDRNGVAIQADFLFSRSV